MIGAIAGSTVAPAMLWPLCISGTLILALSNLLGSVISLMVNFTAAGAADARPTDHARVTTATGPGCAALRPAPIPKGSRPAQRPRLDNGRSRTVSSS